MKWSDKSVFQARLVCAVGNRTNVAPWRSALNGTFPHVRTYGLVPAGNPRVVVPLDTPHHASTALYLHRPGRRLARTGVAVARLLADSGVFTPLRRRLLLIAERDSGAVPKGTVQTNLLARVPTSPLSYALYLGAAGDNRKTVVLPLGEAEPEVILQGRGLAQGTAVAEERSRRAASAPAVIPGPLRAEARGNRRKRDSAHAVSGIQTKAASSAADYQGSGD